MKKNVLKKFAAAALAAATVMSSMSVMAFAAEPETGSVTITKYMSNTGDGETLSPEEYTGEAPNGKEEDLLQNVEFAYVEVGDRVQVDTVVANSSQTEIQYKVTNSEFLTAIGLDETKVNENFTQTELNSAIKNHKNKTIKFVKDKATASNKKPTAATTGAVEFSNLSLHKLYVFAETDAKNAALASDATKKVNVTKVSVPFLVSLPFTGQNGEKVTNLKVYPKNSTGNVNIDKKIDKVEETPVGDIKANANIGDIITYEVKYSVPVPENGLTELKIIDTMDKGLTFTNEAGNIIVKDDKEGTSTTEKELVYGTNYTVVSNNNTVTIDFQNYLSSLQWNSTEEFTITYKVKLNENAVLGKTGNKNKVDLQYKYENNGTIIEKKVPGNDTTVFTYGIDLLKKGEGTTPGLKDVEFKLTDGTEEIKVKKSENAYYPSNDGDASSTVITDADGKIYIRGLKPGTYKLTETKTNAGYVLLKNPVVIVIEADNATGVAEATVGEGVNGKKVTMNSDQYNSGSDTAEVPLTVVNSKGFDLPATGGRGIALFTIAGIAIVAAAGSLLFMRKRSK